MKRAIGLLLVIVSAITFGTLGIFGRYAYADGMDTFSILFLRFTLAASILLGWLALRRIRLPRGPVFWKLVGMGALGYVGQSFCYFSALKYASPGLVALLLDLYPVLVALLTVIFLRTRLTKMQMLALGLAVAGTALTVSPGGGQLLGILFALSAAVIYSVYILVGAGVMRQVSALVSSAVIFSSAAIVYGGLVLFNGFHPAQSGNGWAALAGLVIFGTIIPVATFLAGMERVGPNTASTLSTLEPAVTVALSAWLFDEGLAPLALIGGFLIIVAVVVLAQNEIRMKSSIPQDILTTVAHEKILGE